MKVSEGQWDVRCPDTLKRLFPERRGYYYRVDIEIAAKVLRILSEAYGIPGPKLAKITTGSREYAKYEYDTSTIQLRSRNHLKSVFHEFYHHLDNMTDGMYNSDDREGASTSLAWIFAEKLWAEFTQRTNSPENGPGYVGTRKKQSTHKESTMNKEPEEMPVEKTENQPPNEKGIGQEAGPKNNQTVNANRAQTKLRRKKKSDGCSPTAVAGVRG